MVPELQISKQIFEETTHQSTQSETGGILAVMRRVKDGMSRSLRDLHLYFHHRAFLPSIACAFLYFTVLNFSGQMVTYLLSVGYNSIHIAIARTVSVAFEISATWIAPAVMGRMGPVRTGLWFISWQMMCLAGAAAFFWGSNVSMISTFALVGGTILSRIGLWGFDLCTQIIIQEVFTRSHRTFNWRNTDHDF
jgi:iron-regulated transporter 1